MTYAIVSLLVYLVPFAFAAGVVLLLAGACAWTEAMKEKPAGVRNEFEFAPLPAPKSHKFGGSHGFHVVGFLHRRR